MSYLYIDEMGTTLKINGDRLLISYADDLTKEIPLESVEGICLLSPTQLTAKCIQVCLQRGIPVMFFSKGGLYFGKLQSAEHVNTERQRMQCALYETEFALVLSKQLIHGKIRNQEVVLYRYGKSKGVSVQEHMKIMQRCREKLSVSKSIDEVMGLEGYAAKTYFAGLAALIEPEFVFQGRSKRPPKDEFNSLLSLGYAVLRNMLYGCIEAKGLNPYFGFMHRDREQHPTLASDLMEEWRAVLVDSTAMSMINGHELHKEDFYRDYETGACMMTKKGINLYLRKLTDKLKIKVKYLPGVEYPVSFRQGILLQLDCLVKAMTENDASLYKPILIR